MYTDTMIVLAGGMSSRMKKSIHTEIDSELASQANSRSKSLITIGKENRPVLDILLFNAKSAGIKRIVLLTSESNEMFKSYYGFNKVNDFHGMRVTYAVQKIPSDREKPYGTADALLQTIEQHSELNSKSFIVCNSDNFYSADAVKKLIEVGERNAFINYDREGFRFKSDRASAFAITEIDENNYLTDIIEKPTDSQIKRSLEKTGSVHVSMNIFKLSGKDVYPFLKTCPVNPLRNEKELPTALLNMVRNSATKIYAIPMSEHVPDLTSKEDIFEIQKHIF